MDYNNQKKFFQKAYDLKDKRLAAGYGWPLEVDDQLIEFLKLIKKSLTSGKALDLGCGQGRHTIYLAQNGFESYGIDYIESVIEEAKQAALKKEIKNAHFRLMDILRLDFPKNFFDIVLDWSILDHIKPEDWSIYIDNILNVLKTGGFLILTEFSANDKRIKDQAKKIFESNNVYDHYFRKDEIRNMFSENFEIISINETMLTPRPPHLMLNVLLKKIK